MKTIHVQTGQPYDILVDHGLLTRVGDIVAPLARGSCVIITDSNVGPLNAATIQSSLETRGFRVVLFTFPAGEASKCASTLFDIYHFLCENHITRSDCLIALGGGVVGDITGYAAATFLRGMQYIQIPTSLLAQVDSSVGGKTAIDLPEGKNLVGSFKQPEVVICDLDVLTTLPQTFLVDGMGEVIKYGMIRDHELFSLLESLDIDSVAEHFDTIIPRCIEIKRDVVQNDEFDLGERMILNFGHTLGHAIEAYHNYGTYTHGCAVAIGMCLMARHCGTVEEYNRLTRCVNRYTLPYEIDTPLSKLTPLCGNDKKRAGRTLRYITCSPIGQAQIQTVTYAQFCNTFKEE